MAQGGELNLAAGYPFALVPQNRILTYAAHEAIFPGSRPLEDRQELLRRGRDLLARIIKNRDRTFELLPSSKALLLTAEAELNGQPQVFVSYLKRQKPSKLMKTIQLVEASEDSDELVSAFLKHVEAACGREVVRQARLSS